MKAPPTPPDEAQRLEALYALGVLDTEPEERFDRLTRLASQTLGTSMSLVSLVDRDRQWAKSSHGIDFDETSRDVSFCGHAILQQDPLVVKDARQDPRFEDNPLVTGAPHIRFYAGAPLQVRGHNIGTLCIFDSKPRRLSADEEQLLIDLAHVARDEIEDVAANAAEERLRRIIQATPDAIIMADTSGLITHINPATTKLLGHGAEVLGKSLTVIMPERFRAAHEAGFQRYMDTGEAHVIGTSVELAALHKDGHEVPVELSLAASESPHGLTLTGILRDLTKRRELEEERVHRKARETDLAAAQELSRLKGEFINTASHELYTPLTPLFLQIKLLKQQWTGNPETLAVFERNLQRIRDVIRQVMRVARLDAPRETIRERIDIAALLADIQQSLAPRTGDRGVALDLRAGPGLHVAGDTQQLHDALWNILDNGMKHTPAGGTIRATAERDADDVVVTIMDGGPGFPADILDKPFQAFVQGRGETRGWGLGLFVAKTVLARHDGKIALHPGKGARVTIRLPLWLDDM